MTELPEEINPPELQNDWHNCHFCGTGVKNGFDSKGNKHWLSDCRPDLVRHEIGPTCTWHESGPTRGGKDCYAYQNRRGIWTDEHIHFYKDGPM